jgi:hypothetical protein
MGIILPDSVDFAVMLTLLKPGKFIGRSQLGIVG